MPQALKQRKEKLSIFLVKDSAFSDNELIEMSELTQAKIIDVPECQASLYGKKPKSPSFPKWSEFLTTTNINSLKGVINQTLSTGAILTVRAHNRIFILTFGTSAHLIQTDRIERDFGFRVTLNSVDPKKLRSLDKASYDSNPLNSRNQSTIDSDMFDLSIDAETDLMYAVTGTSKVELLGTQLTGRDALVINTYVTLSTLHHILETALSQYNQQLPAEFQWVENLNKIKDSQRIEQLDAELDIHLASGSTNELIWIGEPNIVDWENIIGYSFDQKANTSIYSTLQIDRLKEYMAKKGKTFNCHSLRTQKICMIDNNEMTVKTWRAYQCLYAEITLNKELFILRNSIWYRVQNDLISSIDNFLTTIPEYEHILPEYSQESEGKYNDALGKIPSYDKMDAKNIHFGGAQSKIEFCDLIKDKYDLIHVKYYRSSATLSHLFAQGVVSAEAFAGDPYFRKKLNTKLPPHLKLSDTEERPEVEKYCVVYAIVTKKKDLKELPFFSKITLKNAVKQLKISGFVVKVAFIDIHPVVLAKAKIKSSKKKAS